MNITDTQITPAQLLAAAREGKITASVIDAETLPPLAGGDGPEQYPSCTIALQIIPQIGPAQTLRTLRAWKLVYYSTDGDTLNSGRGTYDFRAVSSDGATRGDSTVTLDYPEDADEIRAIHIETGEGMSAVDCLLLGDDLTEDEASAIKDAIETAIEGAYSDWSPEHPDESEIYAALTERKQYSDGCGTYSRREKTMVDAKIAGETISVKLYAGTHCGQSQFAFEGDESETVYETAQGCAEMARERLEELCGEAKKEVRCLKISVSVSGSYCTMTVVGDKMIMKDWLEAQLALVRAGMADVEQVFLPYAQNERGETVFDTLRESRFHGLALPESA